MKEEIYEKLNLHEQIIKRPSTYIGSVLSNEESEYIFEDNKISKKNVMYNQGFLKIFDEVLVNAIDHSVKNETVTNISVEITKDFVSVSNNGPGIPVKLYTDTKTKEQIYIPQMLCSELLTSSNYDDRKERVVGGTNGYGLKLTSIFSTKLIIETVDAERKLHYKQTVEDNMFKVNSPVIQKYTKASFTKITFYPDLKKFKMTSISNDLIQLMTRRVYDIKACVNKKVKVFLNNKQIEVKDFTDYTKLYMPGKTCDSYEKIEFGNYIWEIAVYRNTHYQQVSFVNGVYTRKGGKHVDCILKQISKKLITLINTKKKVENLKAKYIEDHLFLFVRATINQPEFSSQSKEELTTPISKFFTGKEKIEISDNFISKLYKSGIVNDIIAMCNFKNEKEISKTTDGSKKSTLRGIPELEDADFAGTKNSSKCMMIFTEGLSAKSYAMMCRSVLGTSIVGVFPLKGKILNVRDATVSQLINNKELQYVKQILGLKNSVVYTNTKDLRYSKVLLLTDADVDGYHIKALFVNFIHYNWPELLKLPEFLGTVRTPIIKVTQNKKVYEFFTEQDYQKEKNKFTSNSSIKYYKGLGTSSKNEAHDTFKRIKELGINYFYKDNLCNEAITLAFDKDKNVKDTDSNSDSIVLKCSDQRKEWLRNYNRNSYIRSSEKNVSYQDLINKELIHFSNYDNDRSIPNVCDGLKPSQRKILYCALKNNIKKEIKVAQFASKVAEQTSYHHGENSLQGAIIGMAQDFIGTNNINLLHPSGNFGSAHSGPKTAASPRYIFTHLSNATSGIFLQDELNILKYLEDDGTIIEPEYFMPVIPMILVNGCEGIGTGYSTTVLKYNIEDIIENVLLTLQGKKQKRMIPWFKNFKGTIQTSKDKHGTFISKGTYKKISNTEIRITSLPIKIYTNSYKDFLDEKVLKGSFIKDYKNHSDEKTGEINFVIEFEDPEYIKNTTNDKLEKDLKLTKSINENNMYLFNENLVLTKYNNPNEIIRDFCKIRIQFYTKKKEYYKQILQKELDVIDNKIRFIKEYVNDILLINKKSKKEVIGILTERKYHTFEPELNYEYLIGMPISSVTLEKIKDLESQQSKKKESLDYYINTKEQKMWETDITCLQTKLQ